MITLPTVLILGAGASAPYGLPVGSELKKEVIAYATRLARAKTTNDVFWSGGFDFSFSLLNSFADDFEKSQLPTIDEFLGHRPEYAEIGKALIATILLTREKVEMIARGDWYDHLFDALRLAPGQDNKEFSRNQLTVITFNYDRSVEYFLHSALSKIYDNNIATTMMLHIPVHHIHGSLGKLPWQNVGSGSTRGDTIEYGGKENLWFAASRIKTIFENDHGTLFTAEMNTALTSAKRIFFIGCGYHKQNMQLLGFPHLGYGAENISGTTRGLSELRMVRAESDFRLKFAGQHGRKLSVGVSANDLFHNDYILM